MRRKIRRHVTHQFTLARIPSFYFFLSFSVIYLSIYLLLLPSRGFFSLGSQKPFKPCARRHSLASHFRARYPREYDKWISICGPSRISIEIGQGTSGGEEDGAQKKKRREIWRTKRNSEKLEFEILFECDPFNPDLQRITGIILVNRA